MRKAVKVEIILFFIMIQSIFVIISKNIGLSFCDTTDKISVVNKLIKIAEDESSTEDEKISAISSLGEIKDETAKQFLIKALKGKSVKTRIYAFDSLLRICVKDDLSILIDAWRYTDESEYTIIGNKKIEPSHKNVLSNIEYGHIVKHSLLTRKISDDGIIPLLTEIVKVKDYTKQFHVCNAIALLGYIKAMEAVPLLIEKVKDKNFAIMRVSIFALKNIMTISDKEVINLFINMLSSGKYYFCDLDLLFVLGEIGSKEIIPICIEKISKPSDPYIEAAAYKALSSIKDEDAVEPLMKTIENEKSKSKIKGAAINSLGNIGNREAVDYLIKIAEDENIDGNLRINSVNNLGKIKAKTALQVLLKTAEDKNRFLMSASVIALGELGDNSAVPVLNKAAKDKDSYVRTKAVISLGNIGGKEIIDTLKDAIKDKSRWVRLEAVKALGKSGTKEEVSLLEKVAKEDYDKEVRETAGKTADFIKNK